VKRCLGSGGSCVSGVGFLRFRRQRRASHLTLVEREEISRGIAAGVTARSIAARIGRPSSTVSREIVTNGGRAAYRRWLPIRLRSGGRGVRK